MVGATLSTLTNAFDASKTTHSLDRVKRHRCTEVNGTGSTIL